MLYEVVLVGYVDIIDVLFVVGVNLEVCDVFVWMLWLEVVCGGCVVVVEYLLLYYFDFNVVDGEGCNVVLLVCMVDIVLLLLVCCLLDFGILVDVVDL